MPELAKFRDRKCPSEPAESTSDLLMCNQLTYTGVLQQFGNELVYIAGVSQTGHPSLRLR